VMFLWLRWRAAARKRRRKR